MAAPPQPKRRWPSRSLIWEAADPYLHLRTTRDGQIVVGVEDEERVDAERRHDLIPESVARIGAELGKPIPARRSRS